MRCAWVKINLHQLTLRLWRSHGKWLSDFEVRQWLKNQGYTWTGGNGNWYTCADGPAHLEKDEILHIQTRVTENGVTFIAEPPDSVEQPSGPESSGSSAV